MAGDWMKVELDLPDKPEVHYIAGVLSIEPAAVVGNLVRVWAWFNKHTEDGNAFGVSRLLVDRVTGVTGFGEAMVLAGWLEEHDKTLHMPKFDRHTSESAKKRALTARRVAAHKGKGNANTNADSVTDALPREEKRREEVSKVKSTVDASASTARPSIAEISAYCAERGNLVDPQAWFDHYTANGWRVGKNPMKDWRAAVRTWERGKGTVHAKPAKFNPAAYSRELAARAAAGSHEPAFPADASDVRPRLVIDVPGR